MLILGIESSCDETAASVVQTGREVRSNVVWSQIAAHQPYGGVVPEIASRAHLDAMEPVVRAAMHEAAIDWDDLDAIAVTHGPGLASSLLMGVTAARALGLRIGKPVYGIHHLAAHCYSVFLDPDFPGPDRCGPLLVLLVTGGNTQLLRITQMGEATLLGQTLDDAVGEALDKGATLMGLGYPGGPAIEKASQGGDPTRYDFPRGLKGASDVTIAGLLRERCFSFSGLKTALRYRIQGDPACLDATELPHVAASYQEAAFDALLDRVARVWPDAACERLVLVGGVARNQRLRAKLDALSARTGMPWHATPPAYCTDNAAMIAGLAGALCMQGKTPPLASDVYPSLPLAFSSEH